MSELEKIKSKLNLLAEILEITPRRVQQLANEGIIPAPEKQGAYNIPACVQSFYYKEFAGAGGDDEELDGRYERARKAKAEADRIEFDLKVKQGAYLQADLVKSEIEKSIGNCRAKLLALPRKFTPQISVAQNSNEIEDLLTNGVIEALNELVEPDFYYDTNDSAGNNKNTNDN